MALIAEAGRGVDPPPIIAGGPSSVVDLLTEVMVRFYSI